MRENGAVSQSAWLFFTGLTVGAIVVVPIATIGFALPKAIILSATAFLTLLWILWKHEAVLPIILEQKIGIALGTYILVVLTSPLWSIAPIVSVLGAAPRFEGILLHTVFFAVGLTTILLMQETHGWIAVCITLLVSNLFIVLYGFLQLAGGDPLSLAWESDVFFGRVFSTLGQPNALGQFILLTLPFVLMHTRIAEGGLRIVLYVLTVLNGVVLVATGSRAATIGLVVACLLVIVAIRKTHRQNFTRWGLIALAAIFGTIVFFTRSHSETTRSLTSRTTIFGDVLSMVKDRPQGWGLETTGLIYPRFQDAMLYETESLTATVDRAHSKPLDLFITLGPVGLFAYYIFLILLLQHAWNLWKHDQNELALTGFIALAGFSTSLLFGFESVTTHTFFWVIIGLLLGLPQKQKPTVHCSLFTVRCALIILSLLTLASTISSVRWFQARLLMNKAEWALLEDDLETAVRTYSTARKRVFGWDRVILVNGIETALLALERSGDEQTSASLDQFITGELNRLHTLTNGEDGMEPLLRAWQVTLTLPQRTGAIESNIQHALSLLPVSIPLHRTIIHIYDVLGEDEKKQEWKQKLLNILPPSLNDPDSDRGRILRKENPWLQTI